LLHLTAHACVALEHNYFALACSTHSLTCHTVTRQTLALSTPCHTPLCTIYLLLLLLPQVGDVGLSRLMPGAPGRTQLEAAAGGPHVPPQSTMLDSRLVGTPSYMDPEYLRTGRFGPKSDTYSLGE
jgi:serine/threonine protein kinase